MTTTKVALLICMLVQQCTKIQAFAMRTVPIIYIPTYPKATFSLSRSLPLLPKLSKHHYQAEYLSATSSSDGDTDESPSKRIFPKHRSLTLPTIVGTFYGVIGLGLVQAVRQNWISAVESTVGCGLLWIGFVLAISFTEAWVKFRAPFLPRHYGLDVGRTVFPVLNAVEVAFCATLWLIQSTTRLYHSATTRLLSAASLILVSQILYLTPKLVLMGKHVILEAFPTPKSTWSAKQAQMHEDLSVDVNNNDRPSSRLHVIYVLEEFAKVILLAKFVWSYRKAAALI